MKVYLTPHSPKPNTQKKQAQDEIESLFIKEIIKPLESHGTGINGAESSQFSSMLIDEYARAISTKISLNVF